jgi:dihydroflavonol-4-reductase
VWQLLSGVTGKAVPRWRAPYALVLAIAQIDEMRCRVRGAAPFVPVEGVRMSRERMFADSAKAQRELQFRPGSVRDALSRAVEWYRSNGYV